MKLLVFDPDPTSIEHPANLLKKIGHDVKHAASASAARTAWTQDPPHAFIVVARTVDAGLLDVLRGIRQHERAKQSFVVTILSSATDEHLARVYTAGADAHMIGKPADDLALARITAIERLLCDTGLMAQAKANGALSPIELCGRSVAWREAGASLAKAAEKILTLPTAVVDVAQAVQPFSSAASIEILSASSKVSCRITVAIDAASSQAMVMHMFGENDMSLAADMLGEVANVFMGTMKSGLNAEALGFAAGLPAPASPEKVLQPQTAYPFQHTFVITAGTARFAVHLGLSTKANSTLSRKDLKEGMVLAKDLFNARGVLVVPAGTRLSDHMLQKLGGLLAPTVPVEVVAA